MAGRHSSEHAGEIDQFFAGTLKNPLEVLLAVDEAGRTIGFAELSIRNYAEDCETDRVAYSKAGRSMRGGGGEELEGRWSPPRKLGRARRAARSLLRTRYSTTR